MEFVWIMIGTFVVGGIIFAFQQQAVTAPGRDMAQRFAALGTLSGRTEAEIVAAVGQPSSRSAMPEGKTLLQWQPTGYHIALLFKDGVCEGVTHEYLHQG